MKRIVKKNQVILTLLAVMIAVAGYLNYAGKANDPNEQDKETAAEVGVQGGLTDISDEDILAENQQAAGETLVDVDAFPDEGSADEDGQNDQQVNAGNSDGQQNQTSDIPSSTPGEAILTNGVTVADYVAAVQLNREQVRARNKETLLAIINNQEISEALKQSAVDMMVKMTKIAELESAVETLLSAKGFDCSVVSLSDTKADVIVSRYVLTDAERAQIEDIVERKTGIGVENIVITLMELAEE